MFQYGWHKMTFPSKLPNKSLRWFCIFLQLFVKVPSAVYKADMQSFQFHFTLVYTSVVFLMYTVFLRLCVTHIHSGLLSTLNFLSFAGFSPACLSFPSFILQLSVKTVCSNSSHLGFSWWCILIGPAVKVKPNVNTVVMLFDFHPYATNKHCLIYSH